MKSEHLQVLNYTLDTALVKKLNSQRQAAIAFSKTGRTYAASCIESDAKLLYVSAVQAVLCRAAQSLDYKIQKIIVMREDADIKTPLTPIDLIVMVDFVRRSGVALELVVIDTKGTVLFESGNIQDLSPYYQPERIILNKITSSSPSSNCHRIASDDPEDVLKRMAIKGADRSFTTYDSASSYGSAVKTKSGNIYYSGQYSSFDYRSMLHAEMGAVVSALSAGDREITDLGLVSTNAKYARIPCAPCACCLQFLSEVSDKLKTDITLHTYAFETDAKRTTTLKEYLPIIWSNI